MSTAFEKVVAVISKKPSLRQDFEIQGLLPWLRKKSQLFSQLKTGKCNMGLCHQKLQVLCQVGVDVLFSCSI